MKENLRAKSPPQDKRYNLRLPTKVYEELGELAQELGTNRLELIRKYIKLGLLVSHLEVENPQDGLYIKQSDMFQKVIVL